LAVEIKKLLDNIQQNLFEVAKQKRDECIQIIHTWDDFVQALNQRKMILAPWCDEEVRIVFFSNIMFLVSGSDFIFNEFRCLSFGVVSLF